MKEFNLCKLAPLFGMVIIVGCAVPFQNNNNEFTDESAHEEVEETQIDTLVITEKYEEPDSSFIENSVYIYEYEENILEQMLDNYDDALLAHSDGNYGLAETKIERALELSSLINFDEIDDANLVARVEDIIVSLGLEFGKIISETSIIREEDPTAWLDDVDIEKIKTGQWTDEELKEIVLKIAVKSDLPIEFNEKVRNAIYFFQNSRRKEMTTWLKQSGRYLPMIQDILEEEGIPRDMAYHAMIESGFNPNAYSSARAVGMWQFIYSTGKIYGLTRNQWIDERRDPIKSTKAAARHLNDLYKISDDWNNVMAAYNAGPNRIRRELEKTNNIEYWDMQLPRETRNHVPFVMAAVVISKEPEIFGFDGIEKDSPFEFDSVEINPYTSLKTAAECAGVDEKEIKQLNPEILTNRVPPGTDMYTLRIPKNTKEEFALAYAKVPAEKYQTPSADYVRVGRGDTFSGIADRHRVSITRLRAANPQITNINRLSIGQRINMPWSTTQTGSSGSVVSVSRENARSYTVQRNDTLGKISQRYGTTVRTLQALNNMGNRTRIIVGQRLLVPGSSTQTATGSASSTTTSVSRENASSYTVQRNDTLGKIAQRYGTTVRTLQTLNNMGSRTRIDVGQRLLVQGNQSEVQNSSRNSQPIVSNASTGQFTYIIQENDTIYEIAQKYGVDFRKIKEINNIVDHRKIMPGQKIIIER